VVVCGLFLGAIFILPAFHFLKMIGVEYLNNPGQALNLILISALLMGLSLVLALVVGPQTAILAELFPAKTRNSAATLPHNLAAGWIGGLLPLIVTWLNQRWQSDSAGLWYPTVLLATAAIIAVIHLPETRKVSLLD
jgi:MFS family permease